MKSKTLIKLKLSEIIVIIDLIYYLIYNTYFGWNLKPKSYNEEICDAITQVLAVLAIGLFLSALFSFMKLIINYIRNLTTNNL